MRPAKTKQRTNKPPLNETMDFAALLPPDSDQRFCILLPATQHGGRAEGDEFKTNVNGCENGDGVTVKSILITSHTTGKAPNCLDCAIILRA
jgi:hypothetical protein